MSKWATRSWPRFRKAGARPYRAAGYHRCCEMGGGCRGGGWGLWEATADLQHRGPHPRRDDEGRDDRRQEKDERTRARRVGKARVRRRRDRWSAEKSTK